MKTVQDTNIVAITLKCIVIITLLNISMSEVCELPQKYTYLSYKSLSKRDTLPDMFTELYKSLPRYETTYTDEHTFNLTSIVSTLIYNEHSQIEKANSNSKLI